MTSNHINSTLSEMEFESTIPIIFSLNAGENYKKGRQHTIKKLSTGQRLGVTSQEDKMLTRVFCYMANFSKRVKLENIIIMKKKWMDECTNRESSSNVNNSSSIVVTRPSVNDLKTEETEKKIDETIIVDEYLKRKEELNHLETKLQDMSKNISSIHISFKDIESLTKKLGASINKRQIEQMIWEIDDDLDGMISWDEFQLTYYRNVSEDSTSHTEPSLFFRIMEFLIFDEQSKGYIIEDDCMEALFARHGSGKLEFELKAIFGTNLRALGGSGTLLLQAYLDAMEKIDGKKSLIPM